MLYCIKSVFLYYLLCVFFFLLLFISLVILLCKWIVLVNMLFLGVLVKYNIVYFKLLRCVNKCRWSVLGIVLKCWLIIRILGCVISIFVSFNKRNFNGCKGVFNMEICLDNLCGNVFIIGNNLMVVNIWCILEMFILGLVKCKYFFIVYFIISEWFRIVMVWWSL